MGVLKNRLLGVIGCSLLFVSAVFAQSSEEDIFNLTDGSATVDGSFRYVNSANGNKYPLELIISAASGLAGNNKLWNAYSRQTHIYVGGVLTPITARNVPGLDQSGTAAYSKYIFTEWYNGINASTTGLADASFKTGKYTFTLELKTSGGVVLDSYQFEAVVKNYEAVAGEVHGTPGTGAQAPTEEEQQGFWMGLIVPDEQCLTDIRDAAEQFTNWGPLGLLNQMIEIIEEEETQMEYTVEPTLTVATGITTTLPMDVGWASSFFGLFRMLLAAIIWAGAIFASWKIAQKVMG